MPAGRPLKFQSAEELEDKINEYFEVTPEGTRTITGLAVHLDTSRKTLMEYETREDKLPELSNAIKKGKDRVEMDYELSLRKQGRSGDIFGLKNFGWRDKTETDITSKGDKVIGINYIIPDGDNTEANS